MTPIERILATGHSNRADDVPIPTDQEFRRIETELGFHFPGSYREFVALGGLGELRIHHHVMSPPEIMQSLRYLPDRAHVPLADNGCGDLYCRPLIDTAEPIVLYADHATGYTYSEAAPSFTDWLEAERD